MKAIRHACFAVSIMLFITASPVHASLYLTNSPTFGPNSITVDTSTGLGWLNLSESAGLSYDQVSSEMQSGQTFSGFQYATAQQVLSLYNVAGLSASAYGDTSHYYPASSPAIQSLFSLIGTTGTLNGEPGLIAISGTSHNGSFYSPGIYGFASSGNSEYWVNDGGLTQGGALYGSAFSDPTISSWLVEEVPEPSSAQLLALMVASWCGFKFWKFRKTRSAT